MIWLRAWFSYIVLTPPLTFDSVLLVTCVLSLRLQILLATTACNCGMPEDPSSIIPSCKLSQTRMVSAFELRVCCSCCCVCGTRTSRVSRKCGGYDYGAAILHHPPLLSHMNGFRI